jgi:glucose/arabinose dehydrogenase
MNRLTAILLVLLQVGFPWSAWSRTPFSPTAISLPPGFQISLFAENLPNARSMASGPDGILFVGTRKAGRACALVDRDGDFKADQTNFLAEGLSMPNGVAFKNGHLYVAEVHRVIRFENIIDHLVAGNQAPQREFDPPAQELAPHAAALGMRFYTCNMFPPEYRGQIFIAEHGSWNRSQPIGYRITRVRLTNGRPASYVVFASGWLRDDGITGRPVDLEILEDGSMLVSEFF